MAESVRGLNVVIGADTTKLGKALADVESKSKSIQSELRQVERLLKFDPSNTTLLAQKQQLLARQIENTSEKLSRLKSVQQQVNEQFRRGEISEGQYRAFQRELEKTEGQLRSLQSRLEETNGAINKHTTAWGKLQEKLSTVGNNLRDVGQRMQSIGQAMATSMGAAATAIGGALGFAVKKSMDFEAQIDRVGAVAGATPAEIKKLEKAALDLGASTSKSATEVAQGMEIMAAMGYNTNQILAAMPGIIAAAEASGEDMALVAETVSAALNAFGLSASEASRVADVLAQAANDSAAGVQDMQYTFKYAAPIAKQLGISLEQLAAATEIMANNGIKGEQAGTTLRAALIRLSDPPREAANTLEALGVKITDANGKMLPFSNIIGQLAEKTKNMSNAQKLAALSTIFGTEAASGMLSVVEAGPQKLDQLTKSLQNSAGASQEAAKKMKDNLKGSLEELQGAFETAQITIGNALAPAIQKVAGYIQQLVDWFNNLSPSTQKTIATIGAVSAVLAALGAAIGVVLTIIGGAVNGFGALALAFSKVSGAIAKAGGMMGILRTALAALTGPVGIAIAAIAGLVAAGVAIYKNWDEIKTKAQEVFGGLSSFLAPAVQAFENFKNAIVSAINGDFSRLGEIFAQIIPSIIAALVGGLPAVLITVSRFLPAIAETISNNTGAVTMAIQNVTNAIVNFLTTSFPQMVTAGVGIITNFVNGIVQSLPTIIQTTATIVQSLAQGISTTLPKLIETGTQVINTLVNAIVTSLPLIIQAGLQLIVQLVSGISQALPQIVTASVTVIQTLVDALAKNLPLLITAGLAIIATLVNAVVKNLPKIIDAGIKILTSIVDGIVRALPQLVNMAVQLITKVAAVLIQNLPKIIDAGVKILLAVVNGIVKVLPQLTNTAVNLIVKIANAIAQNLPKIIDAGVKILTALIKGIIQVLPQLVDAGIKLVVAVAKAVIDNLPKIIEAGKQILQSLIKGIVQLVGELGSTVQSKIIGTIKSKLESFSLVEIGKNIIQGLINGIGSMAGAVKRKIEEIASSIPAWAKKILGIHSPSRVMRDEVGTQIGAGVAEGIKKSTSKVTKAAATQAKEAQKAFEEAFKNAQYKFKMGKIDETEYLRQLRALLKQAKTADQTRKVNLEIKRVQDAKAKKDEEMARRLFEQGKQAIEYQKQIRNVSLEQELQWWNNLAKQFKKGTKERMEAEKEYARVKEEITKRNFENEKRWFEEKKYYGQLSLVQELESLNTVAKRYKKGTEERIYWEKEIYRVKMEIYNQLKAVNEEYTQKIEEANKRLAESERQLTEEYQRAVDERAKSLYSFAGLFDEFTAKTDVTGAQLLQNLRDQVKGFEHWQVAIQSLAARGVDKGLIAELQEMGPKALGEIQALTTLSDSELQEFVNLWRQKSSLAREEAVKELADLNTQTQQKIKELREATAKEIEGYKAEWTAKIKEITTGTKAEFTSWATSMQAIGNQAIKGLIKGMKTMTGPLQAQAKAIADAVSKTIKSALKIKSPSRVMMDEVGKWIPLGLAEGISKHIDAVVSAANRMAQATIPSVNGLATGGAVKSIVNNTTNAPITINLTYNGTGSQQDAYDIVDIIERELGSRLNTRLRVSGVRV